MPDISDEIPALRRSRAKSVGAWLADDDAPKLTQADFDRACFRLAGKDVNRAEWQATAVIRP